MNKEKTQALMVEFRSEAEAGNDDTFKRMSKAERFRIGKQWDKEVERLNKSRGKFTLSINIVLPTVLHLTGTEVQNPRDVKVHHVKGSSKTVAKILTSLAKHTMDSNNAQRQQSLMFDDGITTGRGCIGLDFDSTHDPVNMDIVVRKYDPFMVLPDPNRKHYELDVDSKYIIVDDWVDKGKLEAQYPAKKQELLSVNYNTGQATGVRAYYTALSNWFHGGQGTSRDDYRDTSVGGGENRKTMAKYKHRLSTVWWKEWKKGVYLQHRENPLNFIALTNRLSIKAAKMMVERGDDVRLVQWDREGKPLTVPILHRTRMVGDIMLEDKEDPFRGMTDYPIVMFNPNFVNGYEFGIVENLIGPQEHTNWSWSMELNIVKNLSNRWWRVGSDIAGKIKKYLQEHGSEDGLILSEADAGGKIEQVMEQSLPVAYDLITERGPRHMAQIANVRLESPTTDKDRVASAIRLKQAAAFTGNASLFGNYDYSIEILYRLLIKVIQNQNTFSRAEIEEIIDADDLVDPQLLAQAREEIMSELAKVGKEIPPSPQPPDPRIMMGLSPELQKAAVTDFQADQQEFQGLMQQIDKFARPAAVEKILEQVGDMKKGRYSLKVALAPQADTIRIVRSIETIELSKALVEMGHEPLPRRAIIEAVDPANKDLLLAAG